MSEAIMDTLYLDRIEAGFARLEISIKALDDRMRTEETRIAGFTPLINSRLDAAWKKLDQHQAEIDTLREDLQSLATSTAQIISILKWVMGLVTLVIGSILVALATGHVSIVMLP